jgi:hypothetical protein
MPFSIFKKLKISNYLQAWICLFFGVFLPSCGVKKEKAKVTNRGIYFWKTKYDISLIEEEFLNKNAIAKQYIRFFDVDIDEKSGEARPVSPIVFAKLPKGIIIPTVFIRNVVFQKTIETDTLAKNVIKYIKQIADKQHINFKEIQIDCDWTLSTKDAYFNFLEKIKTYSKRTISVTIRLHQVKFKEKTGVPLADKGVLMVYNTGNWRELGKSNSLFDTNDIMPYLTNLNAYPLDLNIALPIYEQNLLYRNGRFTRFLNEYRTTKTEHIFESDTSIAGGSVRAGDVLKHEKPDFKGLEYIKKEILEGLKNQKTEIIFFHLDQKHINNYTHEQIKNLLD